MSGLISWAEICILLLKASLGLAGRKQQGSSFRRESPGGQAFELTTEAFSPLSLYFLKPLLHLSPHTTRLVNHSKGLSERAGRRKGSPPTFFFSFFKEDTNLPPASLENRRGNRLSQNAIKTSLKLNTALEGATSREGFRETRKAFFHCPSGD